MVYTKMNLLLGSLFSNVSQVSIRNQKSFSKSHTVEKTFCKVVLICLALRKIDSCLVGQNVDLKGKVGKLVQEVVDVFKNIAGETHSNKEAETFEANALAWLLETLSRSNSFDKAELYDLDVRLSEKINALSINMRQDYFSKVASFVKSHNEGQEPSLSTVEEISREFSENWKLKLANLNNEIQSRFPKYNLFSKIIKNIIRGILDLYQEFYSIVKSIYPSFVANMYPVHKLNADIRSIIN